MKLDKYDYITIEHINNIIRPYITDDLFQRRHTTHQKEMWKLRPIQSILKFERSVERYKTDVSTCTQAIIIKLLLKLRGENYMDKIDNNSHGIQAIKDRALAYSNQDNARRQLMNEAKKKGWLGLTIDEVDFEIDNICETAITQVKQAENIGRDELAIMNFLRSYRNDKIDLHKFMVTIDLKKRELDMKQQELSNQKKANVINQDIQLE